MRHYPVLFFIALLWYNHAVKNRHNDTVITLREITGQNLAGVLALQVHPAQMHHIESTRECLDEASTEARWHPAAIHAGDTLIGFAMYGAFPNWIGEGKETQVWLDRLLIDARYQGHGYGEKALALLLETIAAAYNTDIIYLSVYGDNERAISLYAKYGFDFTGEYDTKGERVMRRCSPK